MKNHFFMSVSIVLILGLLFKNSKAEFYTAIAELEKLLGSVDIVVKALEAYQEREEVRLAKVKWLSEQFGKLKKEVDKDAETFLSNPINAFLLIKRLSNDWEDTTEMANNSDSAALLHDISPEKINIPSKDDLRGAASALLRLQSTFLLNTTSLARGEIKGTNSSSELSAGDCLEMGRQALQEFYYQYALLWLEESLRRLKKEDTLKTANEIDILEYLAFAHFSVHNYTKAFEITEKIIDLDPTNPRAPGNLLMYWKAGENYKEKQKNQKPGNKTEDEEWPKDYLSPILVEAFEKLCRGESTKTLEEESRLHCYQTDNGNSYLKLQPVKIEVLHLNPRILMYYDVLRDDEADTIKSVALPVLTRATVVNGTSGITDTANYRISKSAWLSDSDHPVISKLNRRVAALSSLDVKYAEPLHAINYGIGGHYNPHIDFARAGEKISYLDDLGNRLATWIFYLSHVPAGGSTVFPRIGVEVKPVKGAAAFWYNLYQNGTGNEYTIHAACPVLTGSKWVANKWLHENGNEFKRPCSLSQIE